MGETPFAANASLVGLTAQLGLVLSEFTEKLLHRMLEGYHRLSRFFTCVQCAGRQAKRDR